MGSALETWGTLLHEETDPGSSCFQVPHLLTVACSLFRWDRS